MAEHSFQVTISTPDGTVYDGQATMLVVTTTGGQMGLMSNHVPIVATLAIDLVTIKHSDTEAADEVIAVNGGFIEFHDNVATIAADSAEAAGDIDINRAQDAKQRAEAILANVSDSGSQNVNDMKRAEIHLRRAINRLNAAERPM